MNPVLEAIHARRSQNPKFMTGPDLSQAELNVLAEAAAAAPDHGRLGPLRLAHITDRAALADAFAAAAVEADAAATPDDIAAARERAMAGPCLIAVLAHIQPDHPTVPAHEQWVAVGAGLQNLLLAVESLGLQAKMVSGRRVQSAAMRRRSACPQMKIWWGLWLSDARMPRPSRSSAGPRTKFKEIGPTKTKPKVRVSRQGLEAFDADDRISCEGQQVGPFGKTVLNALDLSGLAFDAADQQGIGCARCCHATVDDPGKGFNCGAAQVVLQGCGF